MWQVVSAARREGRGLGRVCAAATRRRATVRACSGSGRALYEALFGRLAARGYRIALAGMTLPNDASAGLHQAMGFEPVGVYRRIGGPWRNVRVVRGPSPIASLSSWLSGGRFTRRGPGRKKPLMILLREQTLQQLNERAEDAANTQVLTRADIAFGDFIADHIASSLEAAYLDDAARAGVGSASEGDLPADDPQSEQDGELAFTSVALSSAVARDLLAQAREDAYRQDAPADPDLDTFMYRRVGQLLEAPYNRRA